MGLDAVVTCRCWQDGLTTTPPPVPVDLIDGRISSVDDKDWELALDWSEAAATCPHEAMEYRAERIGNWAGVRAFEKLLICAGRSMFPTLISTMASISNGGTVDVDDCKLCIAELDLLESGVIGMTRWDIIDMDTGDIISWADQVDLWRDDGYGHCVGGLFYVSEPDGPVQLRETGSVVFKAHEFSQIPDGGVDGRGNRLYVVHAFDDWDVVSHAWTVHPLKAAKSNIVPEHIKIQRSWMLAREHRGWTRTALRNIFTAAIEVGNPVAWG